MAQDDPFPDHAELADLPIVNRIEESLVDFIETTFPPADRSEANVESLEVDRIEWVAHVRAKVVAKNSTSAGLPNPLGGPNLGHFSVTSTVTFDFAIQSGETSNEHLTIHTNGPDIELNIDTIKEVLEGDFAKAIELIPNGGIVTREIHSDYDRIRDSFYNRHGRSNVYFASARFVRWASPGTRAKWIGLSIASGVAASAAIMAEAKKESLKELKLVANWMLSRGEQEALDVAQKLLSGERVDWPNIKLVWQTVRYASRLRFGSRRVGDEFAVNRHAAFVLIWTTSGVEPANDEDDLDTDKPDAPPRDDNIRASVAPLVFTLFS